MDYDFPGLGEEYMSAVEERPRRRLLGAGADVRGFVTARSRRVREPLAVTDECQLRLLEETDSDELYRLIDVEPCLPRALDALGGRPDA